MSVDFVPADTVSVGSCEEMNCVQNASMGASVLSVPCRSNMEERSETATKLFLHLEAKVQSNHTTVRNVAVMLQSTFVSF